MIPIDLIVHHHGKVEPEIKCLDHGVVKLLDCMPRISYDEKNLTCDSAVLDAARISYSANKEKKVHTFAEDRGLIRYLRSHAHTTPSEMVEFKFYHRLPIFVARQLVRHRMVWLNEVSGRYSQLPNEFFFPEELRSQSKTNKQHSEGACSAEVAAEYLAYIEKSCKADYEAYEKALAGGVGKELARIHLPLSLYTEWVWKIDLHNLLHFLKLRCDKHAQAEIQVYANAMLNLIKPLTPLSIEAWEDFDPYRGGMLLSRLEIEQIKGMVTSTLNRAGSELSGEATRREKEEWPAKARRLGLDI